MQNEYIIRNKIFNIIFFNILVTSILIHIFLIYSGILDNFMPDSGRFLDAAKFKAQTFHIIPKSFESVNLITSFGAFFYYLCPTWEKLPEIATNVIFFISLLPILRILKILEFSNNIKLFITALYLLLPSQIMFHTAFLREPAINLIISILLLQAAFLFYKQTKYRFICFLCTAFILCFTHASSPYISLVFLFAILLISLRYLPKNSIEYMLKYSTILIFILVIAIASNTIICAGFKEFVQKVSVSAFNYSPFPQEPINRYGKISNGVANNFTSMSEYYKNHNGVGKTDYPKHTKTGNVFTGLLYYIIGPILDTKSLLDTGYKNLILIFEAYIRVILMLLSFFSIFDSHRLRNKFNILLIISYFAICTLWSTGTSNHGTALRHHTTTNLILILAASGGLIVCAKYMKKLTFHENKLITSQSTGTGFQPF